MSMLERSGSTRNMAVGDFRPAGWADRFYWELDNSGRISKVSAILIPCTGVSGLRSSSNTPQSYNLGEDGATSSYYQKGHLIAAKLGGPDVPQNIVPQPAGWQAHGSWDKMETALFKLALQEYFPTKNTIINQKYPSYKGAKGYLFRKQITEIREIDPDEKPEDKLTLTIVLGYENDDAIKRDKNIWRLYPVKYDILLVSENTGFQWKSVLYQVNPRARPNPFYDQFEWKHLISGKKKMEQKPKSDGITKEAMETDNPDLARIGYDNYVDGDITYNYNPPGTMAIGYDNQIYYGHNGMYEGDNMLAFGIGIAVWMMVIMLMCCAFFVIGCILMIFGSFVARRFGHDKRNNENNLCDHSFGNDNIEMV